MQLCYEFRIEVEPANAFYAAKRRNDAALAAIESALELMRDTTRAHGHREDADYAFHMAIAEAANNYFFLSSMQALKDNINAGMKLHGLSLLGPAGGLVGVLEEHDAIFAAIRDQNGELARDAMRRHIRCSCDRLFEGRMLDLITLERLRLSKDSLVKAELSDTQHGAQLRTSRPGHLAREQTLLGVVLTRFDAIDLARPICANAP